MDEGGRSVPSVSLGKSKGPKTKGQSVCVGPGAQEKGQRSLGASGAQPGSAVLRPWRTPGSGSVSVSTVRWDH